MHWTTLYAEPVQSIQTHPVKVNPHSQVYLTRIETLTSVSDLLLLRAVDSIQSV